MRTNQQILSHVCINLESKEISCRWAAQMLKDWGADILLGAQKDIKQEIYNLLSHSKKLSRKMLITITDATVQQKQQFQPHSKDSYIVRVPTIVLTDSYIVRVPTIVLTDTNISSIHIAAMSGHLQTFGQKPQFPFYPNHLIEMAGATGIFTSTLKQIYLMDQNLEHQRNPKKNYAIVQQPIIKLSLVDLMRYNGIFNSSALQNNLRNLPRGKNVLDGGAPFYSIYECRSDSYLAVGNLQPKFYQQMIRGLQLNQQENEFLTQNQFNEQAWQKIRAILTRKFSQKTAYEWENIMEAYDTCVTQVTDLRETSNYEAIIHPKLIRPKL